MTGYILLGLFIVAIIAGAVALLSPGVIRRRKRLSCPRSGEQVTVDFACTGSQLHAVPRKILRCSGLPKPEKITCEGHCMEPRLETTVHVQPARSEA